MFNLTDLSSVLHQDEKYVKVIFDEVERLGGVVARRAHLRPAYAAELAASDSLNPWIRKYFGNFQSWDEVVNYAISRLNLANLGDSVTEPMRRLIDSLRRQRSPIDTIALHSLESNVSPIGRLQTMFDMAREIESDYISESEDAGMAHYLNYLYKFSPLSHYIPDLWIKNVEDYGETRSVDLTRSDLTLIAEIIVEIQKRYGIIANAGKLDPTPIEQVQLRARENNPNNAHSLPTMTNGKNEDARKEQIELAKEYWDNYANIGVMPFIGARRIQQGGNVINQLISRLYPDFDAGRDMPTGDQLRDAIKLAWSSRPHVKYYVKDRISDFNPEWQIIRELPSSQQAREEMVDSGEYDACILLKHPSSDPSSVVWRFNFYVEEANPWKCVMDDEDLSDDIQLGSGSMMLSKNRVVFAGSGPTTLCQEAFTHPYKDFIKEFSRSHGHNYLSDPWFEPTGLMCSLTNMWSSVTGQPNSNLMPARSVGMFKKLSGDDKSGFDQFQAYTLHEIYLCCFQAPLFKEEHHDRMGHLGIQTVFPRIITFKGMYFFSEAMPSGHGTTNDQDTSISQVVGTYDICQRNRIRPAALYQSFDSLGGGILAQGDDFEGCDPSEDIDNEAKQRNFTKFGLNISIPKSLISARSLEFVRYYSNGSARFSLDRDHSILCLHHPFPHSFVKICFGENVSKNSPCIEEVANIMRASNMQYHPRFVRILKRIVSLTKFGLGTKPQWYVPEYLVKEWRRDGSPAAPSKYHIFIDSPATLNDVAASEAEFKGLSLSQVTKSWTAQQYGEGNFGDLNVVKLLNAIVDNDEAALSAYESRVTSVEY